MTTVTAFFDDLTTDSLDASEKLEPPKIHFEHSPLQYACQEYYKGLDCCHIVNDIVESNGNLLEPKDGLRKSQEISRYFKNKHMIRRLKGKRITNWMNAVDRILDDVYNIYQEDAKIIGTLPRFYEENRQTESLISKYKSVKQRSNFLNREFKAEFVTKIERHSQRQSHIDYYWKTQENSLIRVRTQFGHYSSTAWDFVSKQPSITFKGDFGSDYIHGHAFNVIQPSSTVEIE